MGSFVGFLAISIIGIVIFLYLIVYPLAILFATTVGFLAGTIIGIFKGKRR